MKKCLKKKSLRAKRNYFTWPTPMLYVEKVVFSLRIVRFYLLFHVDLLTLNNGCNCYYCDFIQVVFFFFWWSCAREMRWRLQSDSNFGCDTLYSCFFFNMYKYICYVKPRFSKTWIRFFLKRWRWLALDCFQKLINCSLNGIWGGIRSEVVYKVKNYALTVFVVNEWNVVVNKVCSFILHCQCKTLI